MTIASLTLGIAVGFFMYAFVDHKFNKSSWVNSKYIFWMGVVILGVSLVLFFKPLS